MKARHARNRHLLRQEASATLAGTLPLAFLFAFALTAFPLATMADAVLIGPGR